MSGAPIVLKLDQVSRTFGVGDVSVPALRGVSLTVLAGEFVAVMGPSGSGKSTLLALAGGLDTGGSGSVTIEGQPLDGRPTEWLARLRRRHVGYVFQDYNLVPTLTVAENVALPLDLDGVAPVEAQAQARVALDRVSIGALADRRLDQISGGQRQRVAIARAIVGDRRLILADEPTGALDSATGDTILELLRDLADDGTAVVIVTHEARHAAWADRIVFLRDGRVVSESDNTDDATSLLEEAR